jgi:hypothetical protein
VVKFTLGRLKSGSRSITSTSVWSIQSNWL